MCRLRFDTSFVIRSDIDTLFQEYPSTAVLDSDGNLLLASRRAPVPVVYDQRGRYVRHLGRQGGGPGEFERVSLMSAGPDGKTYVMDPALGRVTVIGTNGMTMTSGVRGFLPPGAMTVLVDGSVVLNAFSMTDKAAPFPFARFEVARGTTVRFGDAIAGFDPHRRGFLRSVLAASSDGGFWAVEVFGGTLRKYGPDLKRQFIRQTPAWFPKGQVNETPSIGQDGRPPTTFARAAAEDSEGRLWIVTSVPSRNWRRFASESTRGIEQGQQPKEVSRLYESMIEVVDTKTGEVIYSTVAPMMIVHALGGGKFLAYSDDDEIPSIAIVRVQLAVRDGTQ